MIAGQHAKSAGIFRDGDMQPKFGREISYRTRPQNAGMTGSPGAVGVEIFALAAIGVVDAAVQHQLRARRSMTASGISDSRETGL